MKKSTVVSIGFWCLVSFALAGCIAKAEPWPDSVLPNADAKASLPDDVLKQADPDSKFKGQK